MDNGNVPPLSLSVQCYTTSYDYVDRMVDVTMIPVALVLVLVVCFLVHRAYLISKKREWERIIQRYVSMFLFITYLVLPGCTTTILKVFECTNADPESLLSGEQYYLEADYSIKCGSSRHNFGKGWAAVCIVVYPIGIPSLYMFLLYLAKDQIKEHKQERKKKEKESTRRTQRLKAAASPRVPAEPQQAAQAEPATSSRRRSSSVSQVLQVSLDTFAERWVLT
jgi:hypothetical protein